MTVSSTEERGLRIQAACSPLPRSRKNNECRCKKIESQKLKSNSCVWRALKNLQNESQCLSRQTLKATAQNTDLDMSRCGVFLIPNHCVSHKGTVAPNLMTPAGCNPHLDMLVQSQCESKRKGGRLVDDLAMKLPPSMLQCQTRGECEPAPSPKILSRYAGVHSSITRALNSVRAGFPTPPERVGPSPQQ